MDGKRQSPSITAVQRSNNPGQSEILEMSQQAATNWPPAGEKQVTNTTHVMANLYTGKM